MAVSKNQQNEALKIYHDYWESYSKGNLEAFSITLDENFEMIGTSESEVCHTKAEGLEFYKAQMAEVVGKVEMRNRNISAKPLDGIVLINETCDIYVLGEPEWTFYSKIRISTLLHETASGWKVIQQHGSLPDMRVQGGETLALEKITKENLELRDAVRRRTIELENKSRELEIEAALERVRSVAMGMKKPEDMLDVCRVISGQLEQFGVEKIRNVQTAIIDEILSQYLCYQYFPAYDQTTIEDTQYQKSPVEQEMVKQMLSSRDGHFTGSLIGRELDEFSQHRKEENHFPDPLLDATSEVSYCFLSIGEGGLGLSLYQPMEAEVLTLFKRFHQVFSLAYQRFRDIQKAEEQAREAEIELALERVRARSMAMQTSEELQEVIKIVYQQLIKLKIKLDHAGFVVNYKPGGDWHFWIADEQDIPAKITHPYFESAWATQFNEAKEKRADFFVTHLDFEEKNKFYQKLLSYVPDLPQASKDFYLTCPGLAVSTVLFEEVSLYIENFAGIPYSDEENKILYRFGKVFQQTYTRFLDLQKAEEQAREAQIEAALERVRSTSLAMHNSQDLSKVVYVVFTELVKLDAKLDRCLILTVNPQTLGITWYLTGKEGLLSNNGFLVENNPHPSHQAYLEGWRNKRKKWHYLLAGEEKKSWDAYGFSQTELAQLPDFIKADMAGVESIHLSISSDDFGCLIASSLSPLSEVHEGIVDRFTTVFNQTYTRFLDLQKAEAQAREAQIQLALERVRARTMAMQKSDELPEAANLLFQQVQSLGMPAWSAGYCTWVDDKRTSVTLWMSSEGVLQPPFTAPTTKDALFIEMRKGQEDGKPFHVVEMGGDKLEKHYQYMRTLPVVGKILDSIIEAGHPLPTYQIMHHAYFSKGFLLFITYEPVPDAHDLFKRFASVFDQTYTRFLDLQKAEAQAREAQIQLALERVRARTMAMQSSEELAEVSYLLNKQVVDLGIPTRGCAFNIYNEYDSTEWFSNLEGTIPTYKTPRENIFLKYYEAGQRGETLWIEEFGGDRIKEHYQYLATLSVSGNEEETIEAGVAQVPEYQIDHVAFFKYGYLLFITLVPAPEAHEVFRRFAKEFEQTYTRFLDLQKAEAQAKEARIEAALERVRSRTMGMQKAEELGEVATVLFGEMNTLVDNLWTCGFVLCEKNRKEDEWWLSLTNGLIEPFFLPNDGDYAHETLYEGWEKGETYRTVTLENEQLQEHYDWLMGIPIAQQIFEDMEGSGIPRPNWQRLHAAYFKTGYLVIITEVPCEEDEIFKRFAQVFDLTYTRFLDLKKAEVQAREAQIANALEKVRSRSLAMQKPDELVEVAELLRGEMGRLGVEELETSSIYLVDPENRQAECWYAIKDIRDGNKMLVSDEMSLLLTDTWVGSEMWKFYQSKKEQTSIVMMGDNRKDWINYCADRSQVLQGYYGNEIPERTYHLVKFNGGYMGAASPGEISPASWDLLKRAASVFSFAFTRFKDLQDAAARTREAQIELALEKVRGRTMAMQSSEELADAAYVLFEQLNILGVTHERINIGIVNEDSHTIDFWITEQGGDKLSTKFSGRISEPTTLSKAYDAWKKDEKSLVVDLIGEELKSWLHYLKEEIKIPFNTAFLHSRRVQTAGFFSKGMLIVTSPEPLQEEAIYLLEKFAKVFDLTYTRFNDLLLAEAQAIRAKENLIAIQAAKSKAEEALTELKATQAQLIQSEKMASLGELTAGIAHEIQNPLNFVNNFSEVSAELVDEMNEELEKGDLEEVKYIASELKGNLNKINHHGKRAGSIVKGMLEHSRKSEGKKELTDLNQLADECLRLSFHGLRAKDKTFQADFKTDLDPNLPKLEVVSQDIGRVLLNLINNAFYAVGERAKMHEADYKPIVTVSSAYSPLVGGQGGFIEVSVQDNGPGIPNSIKDKIFQPFFTTKPTGQGTGLGLSLSYDIVKAHGGELKMETKEGEGSKFIIQLPTSL